MVRGEPIHCVPGVGVNTVGDTTARYGWLGGKQHFGRKRHVRCWQGFRYAGKFWKGRKTARCTKGARGRGRYNKRMRS